MRRAWTSYVPRAPRRRRSSCSPSTTWTRPFARRNWSALSSRKLKIFARARNRQHTFALMDAGVTHIIRETLLSSLDLAASVLQELGETQASARGAVRRFRQHDEATLAAQYAVKEDETKFRATTRSPPSSWRSCSKRMK